MNNNQQELDAISLRVPPQSIESESCVLGALMLDNDTFDAISDLVSAEHFYSFRHKLIFTSIKSLISRGHPADVITVNEHLESTGKAEEVGGISYINSLAQYSPSAANIQRYAEIVREKSTQRALIKAGEAIAAAAYASNGVSVDELLVSAGNQISKIQESGVTKSGVLTLDQLADRFLDRLQEKLDNPGVRVGAKTGYYALDDATGGFQPGDLVILAARPSMGKTALAINIAEDVAIEQNLPVLILSLEMSSDSIAQRIFASQSRIAQSKLRDATLEDSDWSGLTNMIERLRGKPVDFIENGISNLSAIKVAARQAVKRHKALGLIVIDYVQLMEGDANNENRNAEISRISRGLKLLAKEMNCPILLLSQLNRKVEERADKRPMMSDLRESGSLEQDADVIMMMYRDEYYTKEASRDPGVAEVIIVKQRNGPIGTVRLGFQSEISRFTNL